MRFSRELTKKEDLSVRHASVENAKLAYVEKGKGEPVVFVHGALTDLRIWSHQVDHFSQKYRAIAYSRRTHRLSELSTNHWPYLRSAHSRDLITLLETLDLKEAHLVGHAFGGSVALLAALERPDLVRSLTLGEPSPFLELFDGPERALIAKRKIGFKEASLLARRDNAEAAVRHFLSVTVGADVLDQLTPAASQIVMENFPTLEPMLEHYFESPADACERMKHLTKPVLLIAGEFSPKLTVLSNSKLNHCLPHSREATLSSSSHGLHIENPAGFDRIVLDFLEDIETETKR